MFAGASSLWSKGLFPPPPKKKKKRQKKKKRWSKCLDRGFNRNWICSVILKIRFTNINKKKKKISDNKTFIPPHQTNLLSSYWQSIISNDVGRNDDYSDDDDKFARRYLISCECSCGSRAQFRICMSVCNKGRNTPNRNIITWHFMNASFRAQVSTI